jgi:hypothetical protein
VDFFGRLDPRRGQRFRLALEGEEKWIDDQFAAIHPWGFDVAAITTPVGVWHGIFTRLRG